MSPLVVAYQVYLFAVLGLSALLSFDVRRKSGMVPLFDRRLIMAWKLAFMVPVVLCPVAILRLDRVEFADIATLVLTIAGTAVIAKAKHDLGASHSWGGYRRDDTALVVRGIYAWMRHPLYAGVALTVAGVLWMLARHAPLWITAPVAAAWCFGLSCAALAAARETKALSARFGAPFDDYRRRVHPFLPLRRHRDDGR